MLKNTLATKKQGRSIFFETPCTCHITM